MGDGNRQREGCGLRSGQGGRCFVQNQVTEFTLKARGASQLNQALGGQLKDEIEQLEIVRINARLEYDPLNSSFPQELGQGHDGLNPGVQRLAVAVKPALRA